MGTSTIAAALILGMTTGAAAFAQPAMPPPEPWGGWSVAAGYETFAWRDISRNRRPPDASPVSWRGDGPVVTARYVKRRERSAHIGDVTIASAGSFEYVSPASRALPAIAGDSASRLDARYEYRRYFWRDAGINGLDVGLGAQAIGSRVGFTRFSSAAIKTDTRIAGGGGAVVVALDFHRWDRLHLQTDWINGGVISNRRTETSVEAPPVRSLSGGNWLTDLTVGGDWRLTAGLSLSAAWRHSVDGYSSSRLSYSSRRHTFTVGVGYAR